MMGAPVMCTYAGEREDVEPLLAPLLTKEIIYVARGTRG